MTITDRINIRRTAAVMRHWLQGKGVSVVESRVVNKPRCSRYPARCRVNWPAM